MENFWIGFAAATVVWGGILFLVVRANKKKFTALAEAFKSDAKDKAGKILEKV